MKRIMRFQLQVILAMSFLMALPCEARAGFQWISGWQIYEYGQSSYGFIKESYDGVKIENATISTGLASSYPIHDIYWPTPSAGIYFSRTFSLTSDAENQYWLLYLELDIDFQSEFSNFGSYQSKSMLAIQGTDYWSVRGQSHYSITLQRLDGIYNFVVSMDADMSIATFPTPYSGYVKMTMDANFRATAVPEPSAALLLCQSVAATASVIHVSKRRSRKPDGSRRH